MRNVLSKSVNFLPLRVRTWIKHLPGIAAGQRWLIDRTLSGRPFVHTINAGPARGLRFEMMLPRDKAFWTGTFEMEFAHSLSRAVRGGEVCYDIGGHYGYMSGVFALAGATCVVVFEPLPQNVERLRRLAQLNPHLPFQIHAIALGRADGSCRFNVMPDQSMGKLSDSPFQPGVGSSRAITVEVARLDTCVFERGLPAPNLMKIDVEGAEVDVLAGAHRTLEQCRPRLFLEAHSEALGQQCVTLLERINYVCTQLEGGQLLPEQVRHLVAEPS